mmetsp:Transcript_9357/g.33092  ORF Transcript_9357/g.33092 Transcript_9357/m.33092 type:complete len:244 (+) Transcript_9357:3239-3970(+)
MPVQVSGALEVGHHRHVDASSTRRRPPDDAASRARLPAGGRLPGAAARVRRPPAPLPDAAARARARAHARARAIAAAAADSQARARARARLLGRPLGRLLGRLLGRRLGRGPCASRSGPAGSRAPPPRRCRRAAAGRSPDRDLGHGPGRLVLGHGLDPGLDLGPGPCRGRRYGRGRPPRRAKTCTDCRGCTNLDGSRYTCPGRRDAHGHGHGHDHDHGHRADSIPNRSSWNPPPPRPRCLRSR